MSKNTDLDCNCMTFHQLGLLTETWLAEIDDWRMTLGEQAKQIGQDGVEMMETHCKVKNLRSKLQMVQFLENLIKIDVQHIEESQNTLEKRVKEVEKLLNDNNSIDCYRKETYSAAENLNCKLKNIQEVMDQISDRYQSVYYNDNMIGNLINVIEKQLSLLGLSADKIKELKREVDNVNNHKYKVLSAFGLRENKYY